MESTCARLKRLPWPRERGAEWEVSGRAMQMSKMILGEGTVGKDNTEDVVETWVCAKLLHYLS